MEELLCFQSSEVHHSFVFASQSLLLLHWASLVAQLTKNLPAMQKTWVLSLGWEDPLEKEMATYFSILVWRIPWREELDRLQSTGLQRVRHDWATFFFHPIYSSLLHQGSKPTSALLPNHHNVLSCKGSHPLKDTFTLSSLYSRTQTAYGWGECCKDATTCPSLSQSCPTLCDLMYSSTPGFPVLHHLPEFAETHVHLSQWYHPTISSSVASFSSCPLSFLASGSFPVSRLFTGGQKDWSLSFSISPSNEYSGLISFRIDWLYLLAVQWTLKSLLQKHSSKALILQHSAFFMVQLSHLYMTTGKTIALTRWTYISKMMSLLFNILSRLVIAFLPRSKHLLVSWLQSPSAVILEPKKIKSVTVSNFFPIYLPWSDGTGCHDLRYFECWILSPLFHSPPSLSSRGSLVLLHFLPLEWYHLHIRGC